MRQIGKKTIPEPNRTLILSFGPFFKFYFGNLYGIIIIILHPHLNTRFPWHFQSKRILRTYHRTFFISCILAISMLFSTHFVAFFSNLFLPLSFYSRKSSLKCKVLLKLLSKFYYCFSNPEMGFKFHNFKPWFKFCNSFSKIRHFSKPFKSIFQVIKIVVKIKMKKNLIIIYKTEH